MMHGGRTRMRMELEKQRIELERQREEDAMRIQREAAVSQQSSTIEVPSMQEAVPAAVEVPTNILEVRTKLAYPTSYHVNETQKRQVRNFLTQHQSRSAPSQQPHPAMGGGLGLPHGNMTSLSMQRDPLLSGTGNHSPGMKPRSLNPNMGGGSPMAKLSMLNPGVDSSSLQPGQMGGGMNMFAPQHNNFSLKPESPTAMAMDHSPDDSTIQKQIIDDIMGLEEKFGDTLGLPYLESNMMVPQTLPVATNLFDTFGGVPVSGVGNGAGNPIIIGQVSASCPANVDEMNSQEGMMGTLDVKQFEKERQKKNNHNMIERRRRFNINDRIKELGMLLPSTESEARQNKGTILKASVDYIQKLQRESQRTKIHEAKQRQLEDANRQMKLRIQELELTARAHGIATPSLNPETQKLADAADQALGSVTPHNKSPTSASVTPVRMFGGTDDFTEMLRASPGIDFSKLQIKQEQVDSPSPSADHLSPMRSQQHTGLTSDPNQQIGDIFSFNIPPQTNASTMMNTSTLNSSSIHTYGNT